jgi:hypothetical protein
LFFCRDCVYDLIELWNKTGTKWNDIAQLYMKQIDLLLVDYHQWIQDNFLEREKQPSLMVYQFHIDFVTWEGWGGGFWLTN